MTERRWWKSSYSAASMDCVEVALTEGDGLAMRDSKDPDGPQLHFDRAVWRDFAAAVARGEYDRAGG